MQQWEKFKGDKWKKIIDVNDFIINNYVEYTGTSEFLSVPTKRTSRLWSRCEKLIEKEDITTILDIDTNTFSGIDNFEPGYVDKRNEVIVGLQTDEPLKQSVNSFVALESSLKALKKYGYRLENDLVDRFNEFQTSFEFATEQTYTKEIKKYKELHLLEGLPDTYGRGFMFGDYRRLPLYGIDFLISKKENDLDRLKKDINYSMVRTREEVVKQIDALVELKSMAMRYGIDISAPASNAREAVQYLYFAYLAAAKSTTGVTLPTGNNSTFLDIYIYRDIENNRLTESEAQELIDQFVMKLRLIRFLRNNDFYDYFEGKNPIVTETIGGVYNNHSLITKTAYRFLNTLENINEYPSLNFTILYSDNLPVNFKIYCTKIMLKYNALQFVSSKRTDSSNYASTGLAGLSKIGNQIDYYGGTCNLPKALLYAINGGKDEITKELVVDGIEPLTGDTLEYSKVVRNFSLVLKKLVSISSDALNVIHYMHDKYAYESSIMAFNDTVVERYITYGITGLSTVVDSLSAIRYSKVSVNRDEHGISNDFIVEGKFPRFGNNEEQADKLAVDIIRLFNKEINEHHMYRNAKVKVGLESASMNVTYGINTGATPDGRFKGIPFSIGANPVSNVDQNGLLNSLKSVMKIPNVLCSNGIITSINANLNAFGNNQNDRINNIIGLLDGYFNQNGSHIEINIIERNVLMDSLKEGRLNKIIRNGGYVVRYADLNSVQQEALVDKTYHSKLQ